MSGYYYYLKKLVPTIEFGSSKGYQKQMIKNTLNYPEQTNI